MAEMKRYLDDVLEDGKSDRSWKRAEHRLITYLQMSERRICDGLAPADLAIALSETCWHYQPSHLKCHFLLCLLVPTTEIDKILYF